MIRFETERLILRNYTMDDVPAVHRYFSSEEVSRYEDFWPQTMEEDAEGNPIMIRSKVYKLAA